MRRLESPLLLVVLFAAGVLLAYEMAPASVRSIAEDISFAFDSSAAHAYGIGERHFNSADTIDYDVARAEHFFRIAAAKDPMLPSVYHELARIDFLNGDLAAAMTKINFQISMHGDELPNSYYVRALIEGYMGHYDLAASDYEHYLRFDPGNWAALNDYAWVLLKDKKFEDAANAAARGLVLSPESPWLLNSQAIALYELGHYSEALQAARLAETAVAGVDEKMWLTAYPGNDPAAAADGIQTLQSAISENIHKIEQAIGMRV